MWLVRSLFQFAMSITILKSSWSGKAAIHESLGRSEAQPQVMFQRGPAR